MRSDNTQLLWKGDEHPPLDLLREYQEQALPKPESLAVERHLVSCELCTDLVQGMTLSDRTSTRKAVNDLNAQLRNMASRKRKRRLPLIPLLDWRAAASILVLLCSVGLVVFYIYEQIKQERLATARKAEIAAEAELYAISAATDTLLIAVPGYEISTAPATKPAAPALAHQNPATTNPETGKAKEDAATTTEKPLSGTAAGMVAGAAQKTDPNSTQMEIDRHATGKAAKGTPEASEKLPPVTIAAADAPGLPDSEKDTKNTAFKNPMMVDSVLEQSAANALQGRLAGVAVQDKTKLSLPGTRNNQTVKTEKATAPAVVRSTYESMAVDISTAGKQLKGQVLSEQGEALPGVTIVVKGAGTGTSTDAQGNFLLPAPADKATLAFSYIGYRPEELTVGPQTTSVKVELRPDMRALNEVVVVSSPASAAAKPANGLKAFNQYIEQNRQYPAALRQEKISGRVVVGFTVSATGKIENLSIRKSLHPVLDAEAMRLVKDGPAWHPALAKGKPVAQKVKVSIRFRPE